MRGKVKAIRWLRKIDGFGYEPSYSYRPFRSVLGASLTLVTAALMCYYVASTAFLWLRSVPRLSVDSLRNLDPTFTTEPRDFAIASHLVSILDQTGADSEQCILLLLLAFDVSSIRDLNKAFWYNESYVDVTFRHVSMSRSGERTNVLLGTRLCETTLGTALCPDNTDWRQYPLQGRYTDPWYRYIEVSIAQCRGDCAGLTAEEITDFLVHAAFVLTGVQHTDLIFIRNSQDLNTVRETLFDDATSDRWQFKSNTFFKIEAPWRRRIVKRENKYLGQQDDAYTILTFSSYYTVITDLSDVYYKFYVRLDALESDERIAPTETLLDICGRLEAVFSFLTVLTLGVVALHYNRAMFKRRFRTVLTQAGVPPAAQDMRLFDCNHFDEVGEIDQKLLERRMGHPQTATDNLRHLIRQSSEAIRSRQRRLKGVIEYHEPLYWRRKVVSAFQQWQQNTYSGRTDRVASKASERLSRAFLAVRAVTDGAAFERGEEYEGNVVLRSGGSDDDVPDAAIARVTRTGYSRQYSAGDDDLINGTSIEAEDFDAVV